MTYKAFSGYNVAKEAESATTVEKLILTPRIREIITNSGAPSGASDIFSYTPDESSMRSLGSLYVLGQSDTDSSNVGYIVSLIAALARREYYAQPNVPPRDAFARTLHKANEVVEEFFRSGDVKLSIGITAVASGAVMVSKLGSFKILLARNDQVVDIMSNVALFTKEHGEKRKFSSVIHGSVQAGDRILAFIPTRAITSREKNLKGWLLKLPQDEFTERIEKTGAEHATFAATMLHIDIAQLSEQAPEPTPILAWSPRQWRGSPEQAARQAQPVEAPPVETEIPRIIPSEFSRGTHATLISRMFNRAKIVRLDSRGKAVALATLAVLIGTSALLARSFVFTSPQERKNQQALQTIQNDVALARTKVSEHQLGDARQTLAKALATLQGLAANGSTKALTASIVSALDDIDNAQPTTPTLIAYPAPDIPDITLAAWSSASQTTWVASTDAEGTAQAAPLNDDNSRGLPAGRQGTPIILGSIKPDLLLGWHDSVVAITFTDHTIVRKINTGVKSYTVPTQDIILDATEFNGSIYLLTNTAILKVSDLDTEKPITKQWLTHNEDLATGATRILVDGNVWTMNPDGTLTTYYKGAKTAQVSTALSLSGTWRLLEVSDGLLAAASGDARRIYIINPADLPAGQAGGSLVRTLKLDSDAPYTYISNGSNGSILLLTSEGKLWQVK